MGQYVKTLYDDGTFERVEADELIWTHDVLPYQGYRDRDTDVRQVQWLDLPQLVEIFGFPHTAGSSGVHSDATPGALGSYADLVNFRPLYPGLGQYLAEHLLTETHKYVDSIENLNPWWYWNDAAIAAQGGSENLYNHAHLSAAMFQTKAYVLGETFEELAPQLPWTFAEAGFGDIYRLQNLVALLDAYEPSAAEESHKDVSSTGGKIGDTLTYTITLVGSGQPMTLTDDIPLGLSYTPGSAQADPDIGTLSAGESQIAWNGAVPEQTSLLLTFQVQVESGSASHVENVAQLRLAGDPNVYELRAPAVLINAYQFYLPIIIKGRRVYK
jgi:uncharacterized repeat protein (TIGR01451 family)